MTPSLEQFKALLAAAETGSFSAAARRLGKAQSVVSTAIANGRGIGIADKVLGEIIRLQQGGGQ